jgi:hypothetical protein
MSDKPNEQVQAEFIYQRLTLSCDSDSVMQRGGTEREWVGCCLFVFGLLSSVTGTDPFDHHELPLLTEFRESCASARDFCIRDMFHLA